MRGGVNQEGHAQPAPDTNEACAGHGADGNLFRAKPLALVQNGHAPGQVAARATDIQARCRAAGQVNKIPVAQDILLHYDGVGPPGIGAPVKIRAATAPATDAVVSCPAGMRATTGSTHGPGPVRSDVVIA